MMKIPSIKYYGAKNFHLLPQLKKLPESEILEMKAVAQILPFRCNNYVTEHLIDWENIPDDPIFRLMFPHRNMLPEQTLENVMDRLEQGASKKEMNQHAHEIRESLNPHPAGQKEYNIPNLNGKPVLGIQHKYRETLLLFPAPGQSCHAYCTFCFRWPQFVGESHWKFATREHGVFLDYLREHKEITDVLITGGDPMVMPAELLSLYIEPLLGNDFQHIQNIRIGTKSISYWPHRYLTDPDADDLIRLFEKIVASHKHLAVMAHFNHWKELDTRFAQDAIARIRSTGAEIRTQSPIIRHINDSPEVWGKMWKMQVGLGCIPYYMFVGRKTGAQDYFELPLSQCLDIFQKAIQMVSGLGRTVRGPVMSALPGKVSIDGVVEINSEKAFVLSLLQGRNPEWCNQPFFAEYNETATWMTDLKPALNGKSFFYEDQLKKMLARKTTAE